jgi:hypothetical protein
MGRQGFPIVLPGHRTADHGPLAARRGRSSHVGVGVVAEAAQPAVAAEAAIGTSMDHWSTLAR